MNNAFGPNDAKLREMIAALPKPLDSNNPATDVERILWTVVEDLHDALQFLSAVMDNSCEVRDSNGTIVSVDDAALFANRRFWFYDDVIWGSMASTPPELT